MPWLLREGRGELLPRGEIAGLRRWLDALGEACRQRRKAVLALACLSAVVSLLVLQRYWGQVAGLSEWLPPGPDLQAFECAKSEFVVAEDLLVMVSGAHEVERERFLRQLVTELRRQPELFVDLLYQVDLGPLRSGLLFYLSVPQLEGLERALQVVRPWLSEQRSLEEWLALWEGTPTSGLGATLGAHYLRQLERCLKSAGRRPMGSPLARLIEPSQVDLLEPFWEGRKQVFLPIDEGRRYLCFVRPGSDPGRSLAVLRGILAEIGPRNPGVQAELTGTQAIIAEQTSSLQASLSQAVFISLSLVLLALWFNVMPPARVLCGMLTWALGLLWTAALGAARVGETGPLWMSGLTLVAVVSGFLALQTAWLHHLRLTVRVSLAGSLALAALSFSGSPALALMGQMAALGMLASMVALLTVLPALEGSAEQAPTAAWVSASLLPSLNRAGAVLLTTGVLAVGCLLWLGSLSFEANPWALLDRRVPSLQMEMQLSGTRTSSLYAAMLAPDLESARQLAERLQQLPAVDNVFSVAQYMPGDVQAKRPVVERICGLARGLGVPQAIPLATAKDMLALQGRMGEGGGRPLVGVDLESMGPGEIQDALRTFQAGILRDLQRLVHLLAEQKSSPPRLEDLSLSIRERTVGRSGRVCLLIFPRFPYTRGAFLEGSVYEGFVAQLRRVDPEVSGPAVVVALVSGISRQAHYWALGLAWAGLLVGLVIQLRSLPLALLVVLGPSLAWLLTATLLFARGITPNLINWPVPVVHLILGTALSLDSLRRPRLSRRVVGPSLVVLVAALILGTTPHPALAGLGYSLGLSLATNVVVAFTVVPALRRLLQAVIRRD